MNQKNKYWGILSGTISSLLWVLSIPPYNFAEAAYIAFVPLMLWLYTMPSNKLVYLIAVVTGWASWFFILIWLRHVTWIGTILLSGLLAVIFAVWFGLARYLLLKISERNLLLRALGFAGIAGAWVFFEWLRTWLVWGFPWAPLSISQWQRPAVLQICAWTGAYGVSFVLIFFNMCLAYTLRNCYKRSDRAFKIGWLSPDLYLGMLALLLSIYLFFTSLPDVNKTVPLFRGAVVQPYISPDLKWEESLELKNLETLELQTRYVSALSSDVILWPEAATPWPVIGSTMMRVRIERLSNELNKPILMGNLAQNIETSKWSNGIFLVEPGFGLSDQFYTKRELVPFGEYVPPPFGLIRKVVPIGEDFVPGCDTGLINFKNILIGSLICYEDTFPKLARDSASEGAQLFFVATNDAWFGEEGGAEQHAAHSVLRAVENRRPVIRAGNGGWSGWVDSYGTIRGVLRDARGSIYFRGGGAYSVYQYADWSHRKSFYTRYGDWFVVASIGFTVLAIMFCWLTNQLRYKLLR